MDDCVSSSPQTGGAFACGSDDEVAASNAPYSPISKFSYDTDYDLQRSSSGVSKKSDLDIDDSQDDAPPEYGSEEVELAITISSSYKPDPMSTSFYGKLPESDPIPISVRTVITKQYDEYASSGPESSSCVSQGSTKSVDHQFLDEADLEFEKALEEHIQLRGPDVMTSVTSKYAFSPSKEPLTTKAYDKEEFQLDDVQKPKPTGTSDISSVTLSTTYLTSTPSTTSSQVSLPSSSSSTTTTTQQKTATGSATVTNTTTTSTSESVTDKIAEERVASWGKPLGLPSPAPYPVDSQTTPKKERKLMMSKTKLNNEKNLRKRSESPVKGKKSTPIYMDLTYVPHNGNSYYSHVEFFKRVRARYYVFSGTEPSRDVYNALLEAKQTWEDKDLGIKLLLINCISISLILFCLIHFRGNNHTHI